MLHNSGPMLFPTHCYPECLGALRKGIFIFDCALCSFEIRFEQSLNHGQPFLWAFPQRQIRRIITRNELQYVMK